MATLEAAALIKKMGLKPKCTICAVFWTDEEIGERVAQAYRPWIGHTMKNHVATVEMDQGAERPVGFGYGLWRASRLTLHRKESPVKRYQQIAKLLTPIDADGVNEGGGWADIDPLAAAGVPSFSPTTTMAHYFDWHHTEADTLDKVNKDDFRKNAAELAVLPYVLADMPDLLTESAK